MNNVLPIGAAFPRIFKLIKLKFGKPLDLDDLYNSPGDKETSREIVNKMMHSIRDLKSQLDQKMENSLKLAIGNQKHDV
jgi:hypothetical protein